MVCLAGTQGGSEAREGRERQKVSEEAELTKSDQWGRRERENTKGWFVYLLRAIECGRHLCEWPGQEKLAKIGKPFLAACAPPGTYPPAPTSPGDDRMWHCHGANYAELVSNLQS